SNGLAFDPEIDLVLGKREPGTARLDAARRNEDGGLAGFHDVAQIHPRQFLEPDRVRGCQRIRRVDAVVRVVTAFAAASRPRIGWLLRCLTPRTAATGRFRRSLSQGPCAGEQQCEERQEPTPHVLSFSQAVRGAAAGSVLTG